MANWRRKKKKQPTEKSEASKWQSRYIRIKACIETSQKIPSMSPKDLIAQCYTCGKFVSVSKKGGMQMGHFKPRGSGGGSGTYFNEDNIRPQCGSCNAFEGGKPEEFEKRLIIEIGQKEVAKLEILHLLPSPYGPRDFPGLTLHYKAEVEKLLEETGIKKWF